ncbi:MAG: hypothetical protein PVG39_19985 [Desulfobacteraceae bacterium]|jgi:magnesium chelatase family protein
MDRIDIHMDVPAMEYKELSAKEQGKASVEILEDLNKAREIQKECFKNLKVYLNYTLKFLIFWPIYTNVR